MNTPRTLEAAIARAMDMMTEDDRSVLQNFTLDEAQWRLHFTLGHQLRNDLGLWTDDAEPLYLDLMNRVQGAFLVVDGDTASSALISALWQREQKLGVDQVGE